MSVFWYINVHILKRGGWTHVGRKKITVTIFVGGRKKLWLVSHKSWKNRVLKSPAQTAFWTFFWTFSKVAEFATFWGNRSFFRIFMFFHFIETDYAHSFNFEANIFGRKVSEHNDSVVWNMEVWISLNFMFLNQIFLAEKCPNIMIQWIETWRFGILSFYSFLNQIFLAEKYPNIMIQWIHHWRFGNLSIYTFLNEIFLAEKYPNIMIQWFET
jgi:hypothetical protein